jgi:hypothetical protein
MSHDTERMKSAANTLGNLVQKHQAAFSAQGNSTGGGSAAQESQGSGDEKVVDAEFTEIKDDKK